VINNRAVATSGDTRHGWTISSEHFSHVLDPRTGRPSKRGVAASVIAPDAATADVLATALIVLTPEEGIELVDELDGVEAVIVDLDHTITPSRGWAQYAAPIEPTPLPTKSKRERKRGRPSTRQGRKLVSSVKRAESRAQSVRL
jgi:thiamine biosynthesis lipoprotein